MLENEDIEVKLKTQIRNQGLEIINMIASTKHSTWIFHLNFTNHLQNRQDDVLQFLKVQSVLDSLRFYQKSNDKEAQKSALSSIEILEGKQTFRERFLRSSVKLDDIPLQDTKD